MTNQDPSKLTLEIEYQRCIDSLNYLLRYQGPDAARALISRLNNALQAEGVSPTQVTTTPYINTIRHQDEPTYPGDIAIETKISAIIRWNAVAMVVKANKHNDGLGGHISTYASSCTLYEVAFNHFFKGNAGERLGDQIYFQGHASPGIYSRGFLEGRFNESHLTHFRQELAPAGGLSSYPHPYLMPSYWQFPTVSMGLGPVMAIYQARFNRYLKNRGFLTHDPHVWCFIGDGECDEPETLGALTIAAREKLDNLIFVINCNLQRLDGPVRGNSKIIQELEGVFTGAGWNVVKVIWGSGWDKFLTHPNAPILIQRMNEVVDGEYQKYSVMPGAYMRSHFFGKYPELLAMVDAVSDEELEGLTRGGHDPRKVYAGYASALAHKGRPSVVLAKTVKGYGMGDAGEGRNISHQQKKLTERELREYRNRFNIPISDDEIADLPFYRPHPGSPEHTYIVSRRDALGGLTPERKTDFQSLQLPGSEFYEEFKTSSGKNELSTTMAFVRILTKYLRSDLKNFVVPIIPDEGRTFGMEALFKQIGIYSPIGQLYDPVDSDSLLSYREAVDGQILEEGINETGSMSSWLAAGTAYATHGIPMIPFYIFYSMFGLQRVGDLCWLAGDIQSKGFLLGGTAGRTTLNGEGLQHQDGHSHLLGTTIPNLITYDVAFRYEVATILEDGLNRMYQNKEDVFYYITLGNENYVHPEMPPGAGEGILRGLYPFSRSTSKGIKIHLFGSGTIMNEAIRAEVLLRNYGISVDVWGATNYKRLRNEAIATQRWNRFHPTEPPQESYLEKTLKSETGKFFAVSDNMRLVSDQIAPWVPGGLTSLGTDGFGRSETRENLRRFFEVDAECITIAVLHHLAQSGTVSNTVVQQAILDLGVDPEKQYGYAI